MIRRSLSISVLILSLSLLSSCKKKETATAEAFQIPAGTDIENPIKNDWQINWLQANPATLNPVTNADVYGANVEAYVFETLVRFRVEDGKPEGLIAERWDISKDGLIYDFYLRKGIVFHDGKPLTAEDVKFSFDSIMNPKVDAAPMRAYFSGLSKIEVVDPLHIRFHLKDRYYRNLIILGDHAIIPKHIYDQKDFNGQPANRAPIGSGPYQFVKWENGRSIELKRFGNYWGNLDPTQKLRNNFERVIFRIITEQSAAVIAFKKGDIDSMEPNAIQWTNEFADPTIEKRFYKLQYDAQDGAGYSYIGWNLIEPRFQSQKTRLALAMLIPREEINRSLYKGAGRIAVGPLPPQSPKFDPSIQPIAFDLEKAKAMLAEDGWKPEAKDGILAKEGMRLSFEVLFSSGNSNAERIALIYRDTLSKVGIEMNIRTLEWSVYIKAVNEKRFDSVLMGWGASLDSDPYQIWHSSQIVQGGSNFISYKNARVDEILTSARQELDASKRNKLYQEFSRILAAEAPVVFMFRTPQFFVGSKRFQKVLPVGVLGLDPNRWFTPKGLEKYAQP